MEGGRVLWIDDHPTNNLYERVALGELGIAVDLAVSTHEALRTASALPPDLVISDLKRDGDGGAGLAGLRAFRRRGLTCPFVFYVTNVDRSKPLPMDVFGIAERPDTLLHYVFDVLERRTPGAPKRD